MSVLRVHSVNLFTYGNYPINTEIPKTGFLEMTFAKHLSLENMELPNEEHYETSLIREKNNI
jgi:hypothetical protein